MPIFKRSTLGIIHGGLYIRTYSGGYEIYGIDKEERKVVISKRKDLNDAIADGTRAAQIIADIKKRPIPLDILSERIEEIHRVQKPAPECSNEGC